MTRTLLMNTDDQGELVTSDFWRTCDGSDIE